MKEIFIIAFILSVSTYFNTSLGVPLPKGMIVYSSNQSGSWRIRRMDLDGKNGYAISPDFLQAVMPTISPDGKWIAFKEGHDSKATKVWLMKNDGSKLYCAVVDADVTHYPIAVAWGINGFYYKKHNRIYFLNPENKKARIVCDLSDFPHLIGSNFNFNGITSNQRYIVGHSNIFRKKYQATNGMYKSFHSAIILDMHSPADVYFFGQGCEPTTAPMGAFIYHVGDRSAPNSNTDGPDIMRMSIDDIPLSQNKRATYTIEVGFKESRWGHEYFPRISQDNKWLVYGATKGNHNHFQAPYEIFIHKLGKPRHRIRLTHNNACDNWPHVWIGKTKKSSVVAHNKTQKLKDIHIKVNAGGNSVSGWLADDSFVDSSSRDFFSRFDISTDNVTNHAPGDIYKSCRHLNPYFHFPSDMVPNGIYRIRLHFAEPHFMECSKEQRTIDIYFENTIVEKNFNPCKAAGGCFKACINEYLITINDSDGLLIRFDGQGRGSFVMAIEIISYS